jgi:phytanoyl-CoA hydroxylase
MDNKAIAAKFWEDGFIVVPGFFDAGRLGEIEGRLAGYMRDEVPNLKTGEIFYENPPSKAIKSLFGMQRHSEWFKALGQDVRMMELMRTIFPGGEVTCEDVGFFGKAARDGSVTPAHQDNGFSYLEPAWCLKASIGLDEASLANGVMFCQKGSHRIGLQPHEASGVLGFSQKLREPVSTELYPEVPCCMKPGDLTLHHTDTVHRSEGNPSSQSRRMLSMIYKSSLAVRNQKLYDKVEADRKALYAAKMAGGGR